MMAFVTRRLFPSLLAGVLVWWLSTGDLPSAQADNLVTENLGKVEMKIRATDAEMAFGGRERTTTRSDQATAIVVDGVRLLILPETVVIGQDGNIIDFNELPVPSRVRIVQRQAVDGNIEVLELAVQRVLAGADKAWPRGAPN